MSEEKNYNRREFLGKSIKTITIGALTLTALDITKILAKNYESNEINNQTTKVIKVSDYPELASAGGYTLITNKVIVIRVSSSKFIALNITCTHKKCDVEYDGNHFECPCHGSEYDKYGKVTHGPATKNLTSYKTSYNADSDELTINM
jgi:cytochrome b6-f complex iron-sulfur subunit